jgi:hypothetical protein
MDLRLRAYQRGDQHHVVSSSSGLTETLRSKKRCPPIELGIYDIPYMSLPAARCTSLDIKMSQRSADVAVRDRHQRPRGQRFGSFSNTSAMHLARVPNSLESQRSAPLDDAAADYCASNPN